MKDNNFTEEKKGNKGKIFGWTLIYSLLMAANPGMFLRRSTCHLPGRWRAFLQVSGLFVPSLIHSLVELKSWGLILINGFYSLVALTLIGQL